MALWTAAGIVPFAAIGLTREASGAPRSADGDRSSPLRERSDSGRIRATAAIVLMLIATAPAPAAADAVALVAPDATWREAVAVALEPWGVRVVEVAAPRAGSPTAYGAAAARRAGAPVAVWFSRDPDGAARLWIYVHERGAAEGHEVAATPPFDAPTAAAVALSLKTRLRQSPVGPRARSTPPAPVAPVAPVAPIAPRSEAPVPADGWTVELATGARFSATHPDRAEHRVTVAGAFWPAALERHLGIGVRAASGPGVEHDGGGLEARWVDTSLELGLEGRWAPVPWFELGARAGGGLHVTALLGELVDAQVGVEVWRAFPSASAGISVGWRPSPRLWIGARVDVDVPLVVQRYRLEGASVLDVARGAVGASLGLEIDLGS